MDGRDGCDDRVALVSSARVRDVAHALLIAGAAMLGGALRREILGRSSSLPASQCSCCSIPGTLARARSSWRRPRRSTWCSLWSARRAAAGPPRATGRGRSARRTGATGTRCSCFNGTETLGGKSTKPQFTQYEPSQVPDRDTKSAAAPNPSCRPRRRACWRESRPFGRAPRAGAARGHAARHPAMLLGASVAAENKTPRRRGRRREDQRAADRVAAGLALWLITGSCFVQQHGAPHPRAYVERARTARSGERLGIRRGLGGAAERSRARSGSWRSSWCASSSTGGALLYGPPLEGVSRCSRRCSRSAAAARPGVSAVPRRCGVRSPRRACSRAPLSVLAIRWEPTSRRSRTRADAATSAAITVQELDRSQLPARAPGPAAL